MHAMLQLTRSRVQSWLLLALLAVGALAISTPVMAAPQGLRPSVSTDHEAHKGAKKKGPKPEKAERFEVMLLKKLIDREARITSTSLLAAQSNTTDTFVLAIADTISSQSQANLAFLKDRLNTWYGIDYNGKRVRLDDDLTTDSANFDIEFILKMKGLLQSQVAHYSQAARLAPHPALKEFAREAILDYRAIIQLLKEWLAAHDPDLED